MEKNCDQAEEVLLNFYTNFLRTPQGEEVIVRLRVQKFLDLVKTDTIGAIGFAREKLSFIKEQDVQLMSSSGKPSIVLIKDLMNILVRANDKDYDKQVFFTNRQREYTCDFINGSLLDYTDYEYNSEIEK